MSDSEQDPSVLGKRARNGEEDAKPDQVMDTTQDAEDDSDDDIGPMPMPAGAGDNGGVKKKRKGKSNNLILCMVDYGMNLNRCGCSPAS